MDPWKREREKWRAQHSRWWRHHPHGMHAPLWPRQRDRFFAGDFPPIRFSRKKFLFRFLAFFLGFGFLFSCGLAAVFSIPFLIQNTESIPVIARVAALCIVSSVILLLAFAIIALAFRRFGSPTAEVMAAADSIARGDLSVRVNENFPGEFGDLARKFNRMTEELQRSEQQRANLTADIAHELRTPLQILQGNLEGILDGVYSPSTEFITSTLDETRLLSRLVDDLQVLSLAESGRLPLHKTAVDACDLLNDALLRFSGRAAEGAISLKLDISPEPADLTLLADPDRIEQALSNLISNALRHTPRGGAVSLGAEASAGFIRFRVSDTGEGISPEELPFLFDRFWRGDKSRARNPASGSGLGLAIARQFILSHGGTIRADSAPGKGTTITFDLPADGGAADS